MGFRLGDIHPVDGSNPTASGVYLDGSAKLGSSPPPPPGVPEPASAGLVAAAVGVLAFVKDAALSKGRFSISGIAQEEI